MSSNNIKKSSSRGALITLLRRLHFYCGIFIGPFIFIAALTGTLYVLSPQLEPLLYADALRVTPEGEIKPLSQQITAARRYAGEQIPVYAVRPAAAANGTTRVQFTDTNLGPSESRSVFIDPYTLAIRGDMTVYGTSGSLPLVKWLSQLHRSLLLGDIGRNYSELAASWMWITALGGMVLWLTTRPKRSLKPARTAFAVARKWHITLGLCLLLGMVFFSATGLTWSQWAGGNVDKMRATFGWLTPQVNTSLSPGGQAMPADPHTEHHGMMSGMHSMPRATYADADWDSVMDSARRAGLQAAKTEIRPPKSADKAWTVTEIDRAWPTQVDAVAVDPRDFTVLDQTHFDDFPLLAKLTRWGVDAHMGVLFGLPNQLLLAAFGVGLCTLILLGYRLWWIRRPASAKANPAATLAEAWLALPGIWRGAVILVALGMGYALPLMGISLAGLLAIDILRWRRHRQIPAR